jgi:hypothetical protein
MNRTTKILIGSAGTLAAALATLVLLTGQSSSTGSTSDAPVEQSSLPASNVAESAASASIGTSPGERPSLPSLDSREESDPGTNAPEYGQWGTPAPAPIDPPEPGTEPKREAPERLDAVAAAAAWDEQRDRATNMLGAQIAQVESDIALADEAGDEAKVRRLRSRLDRYHAMAETPPPGMDPDATGAGHASHAH